MLFWPVVMFIVYSVTYFVISQRKIRRLRNTVREMQGMNERNVFHPARHSEMNFENN
jgi:hypothetical protein